MAISAIILMIFGVVLIVFANTMIPTVVQSNADLLNPTISGVTLTNSQESIVTASGNLEVLIFSILGVLVIIAGVAVLLYDIFKVGK
jgi:hypothetical protein